MWHEIGVIIRFETDSNIAQRSDKKSIWCQLAVPCGIFAQKTLVNTKKKKEKKNLFRYVVISFAAVATDFGHWLAFDQFIFNLLRLRVLFSISHL